MFVSAVETFLLELPLREAFVASHGATTVRSIVVVCVETDVGLGWGECSALPAATYTAESSGRAFEVITDHLTPHLVGRSIEPGRIEVAVAVVGANPMAAAALEMALIDAELTARGRSLADHLGVTAAAVPAGASLGLDSIPSTVARAAALVEEGYRRLKVKIEPGHDRALVEALRAAMPDVELHVDANGAYPPTGVEAVLAVVAAGVDAVEQPFPPAEVEAAAELVAAVRPVHVVADEAVGSVADAVELERRRALTGVSIKPARVGGLHAAVALHDRCLDLGLAATAGGMLECGLGRHALAALAGLPGFTLTGDLSPAGRWLAADPWPDLELVDGRLAIPAGPGVAPPPDPEVLAAHTVDHHRTEAP